MTRSSVCTALTGNFPAAVSPASMIASTPSSTALAASLTSARVGRGSVRIDSSTCVATMTGMARARALPGDFLLHARHPLERQLEAQVAARHHHGVARLENVVDARDGLGPFELCDERRSRRAGLRQRIARLPQVLGALHEAERDVIDAHPRAEHEVVDVLRRQRARRQHDAGTLIPLCSPRTPPSMTVVRSFTLDAVDAQLDMAVVEEQRVPGADRFREIVGRATDERPRSPPPRIADDDRSVSPGLQLDRPMMLQLAGANLRAAEVLHDGHISSRLFGGSANARDRRAMRLMSPVREIQSKDIHARALLTRE